MTSVATSVVPHVYEAETKVNGRDRDVVFDATGLLIEVSEEVPVTSLPAAIKTGLEQHGKIMKVESVTKGKTVTYEARVKKDGKQSGVSVDGAGKPIK